MGAGSKTVILRIAVELPAALEAAIVKLVRAFEANGIPLIAPVVLSKLRPSGRIGVIDQFVELPPVLIGVTTGMMTPLVKV